MKSCTKQLPAVANSLFLSRLPGYFTIYAHYFDISLFIVIGNMVTIALFAVNRKLRWRRSLFLVISMAFADLMVGAVILLIYIYAVGAVYKFWTGGWSTSLIIFYLLVDSFFMLASLNFCGYIESFYFNQRCFVRYDSMYFDSNVDHIGIGIKWQHRRIRPSQGRNRDLQNRHLTST